MKITTELIAHISQLSRLFLPEGEQAAMAAQLERIVDYMDVLSRLDTGDIEPMSHVFPVRNVLRADEEQPSCDREALLANAPARDEESFLTPKSVE
ncbi:MAG TPA: Asp-tRNA(Asn)/Glu-tRNA(Gln) amidotransferase subunit GatC [Candidatus Enterenecus merdae]|nr:Asp-tRNA(Asn)/Glu-tRNA(Gln) amidotransferase subunit GatC [Candidatus Enterenecus merdae]